MILLQFDAIYTVEEDSRNEFLLLPDHIYGVYNAIYYNNKQRSEKMVGIAIFK